MLNILQFSFNLFQERAAIAWREEGRCVAVDPGFYKPEEEKEFLAALQEHGLKPEAVLLTHAHPDHIYGVKRLQELYGIPVYMHPAEKAVLEYDGEMAARFRLKAPDCSFKCTDIADGEAVEAAGIRFEVIATPGHTPGGVCFLDREDGVLFSGDTLMRGTVGRTDLKGGDWPTLKASIERQILPLADEIEIYPGHGPQSSVGYERRENPYLK